MTRKRLPKAIRSASSDLLTVVGAVADNKGGPAKPAPETFEPDWVPQIASVIPANDTSGVIPEKVQKLAAKRRLLAGRIVEQNGMLAALSGLTPLPAVNIAGVAAVILRMLKQLSELYQIRFERAHMRPFVVGVLGGTVPTSLGAATISTIGLVAPAPAFIELAVSAVSAAAVTRAIGEVFIESFERQAPLG